MPELRFVAAAVLICSWACAGGDAPDPSDSNGAQPLARPEQPSATSSGAAQLGDAPDAEVIGGGESPATEGSNTNWRPIQPWLDDLHQPPAHERPDPRKPAGGQQGNTDSAPDPDAPSTLPGQQGQSSSSGSSSSGSSSGSGNSTPSPE